MQTFSYWEKTSFLENFDVVIAGSGIVGLSAAWELRKKSPKLNILVIERGSIPSGASTRNAGVACFGTVSEILEDLKTHSEDEVFSLIEKRWRGLELLKSNLGSRNIGFEALGGYELFLDSQKDEYEKCQEKIGYINQHLSPIIGSFTSFKSSDTKIEKFGFKKVKHIIENVAEGQIDSGKMMYSLLINTLQSGVFPMFGTEIESYKEQDDHVEIHCSNGVKIKSKKLLIATNGFAKKLLPELDLKPARAQVLITEEIPDLKIKGAFHFDYGYYFFRNVGQRILFGGGRNLDFKTEETTEFGTTQKVQDQLEKYLKETILPDIPFEVSQRWSGIMAMGSQKSPLIKRISPRIFCSVRMSGMGVAIGSQTGLDAANLVLSSE